MLCSLFHGFEAFLDDVEALLAPLRCFEKAWNLLQRHRDCLDRVAEELCEVETITGDRLREIIAEYTEVPEKLAVV